MSLKDEFYKWITIHDPDKEITNINEAYPQYINSKKGLIFLKKYTNKVKIIRVESLDFNLYHIPSSSANMSFELKVADVLARTEIPDKELEKFLMENI